MITKANMIARLHDYIDSNVSSDTIEAEPILLTQLINDVTKEINKMYYKEWFEKVTNLLTKANGLSIDDIPFDDWRCLFDDEFTPGDAVDFVVSEFFDATIF